MAHIGNIPTLVKDKARQAVTYWDKPMPGRYVPFKEVGAFSVGKFGNIWATLLIGNINLTVTNVIITQSAHISIDPMHVQTMNNISVAICFFFTMYRSRIIDNPKDPEKRFKRFIRFHGFPAIALSMLVLWFPYGSLPDGGQMADGRITSGYLMKIAVVLACHLGIQWFNPLFSLASNEMIMVVSPNSQERLDIHVITQFIYSLSWTIAGPIQTWIAGTMFGESKDTNIYFWRFTFIPFTIIGLVLYYFMYYGVKERVILSKTRDANLDFFESLRKVAKNKNFWLLCAAGWAGFLEDNSKDIINWSWRYQNFGYPNTDSGKKKATGIKILIDSIFGFSATISMAATPVLSRFVSKRAIMIASNVMNIFLLGVTYNTYKFVPALVIFRFLNQAINELSGGTIRPAIDADVRDMQQYISGERVDGMFSLVRYADEIIKMGTGYVTPWLQRRSGVFKGNGAVDPDTGQPAEWFILRNEESYDKLARTMIVASVIGATANVIPMFFYDLTEQKQKAVVGCLKIRAVLEDYGNGVSEPEKIAEAAEIIHAAKITAESISDSTQSTITNASGKKEQRRRKHEIEGAKIILDEISKFEKPEMRREIERAEKLVEDGYAAIFNFDENELKKAKALPRGTKEEKLYRKSEIMYYREFYKAHREMIKFYPSGVVTPPDRQELEDLYKSQHEEHAEAKEARKRVKKLEAEKSMFYHSTKPYAKAEKLLKQAGIYSRLEEILAAQAESFL
ncbi:MAG: MFS transporter [Oscillospiraceae bacterium]|nr:MFS transporter [Oscillospiraceae bacterium]